MSKSSRPSLTQLVRHDLPNRDMPAVSSLLEAAVLPSKVLAQGVGNTMAVQPASNTEIQSAVQPVLSDVVSPPTSETPPVMWTAAPPAATPLGSGTKLVPRSGPRRGDPTQSATYRLPLPLYNQLVDVAHHYRIAMTDIVVEALEQHLKNFPLSR